MYYHVVCDGYSVGSTQRGVAIGVDYLMEDESTRRFYGINGITTMTGLHTERVYQLGAGSHKFYFRGVVVTTGTVNTNYHTITVTVYTDGSVTG